MERFDFEVQISRMDEKDLLFQVVQRFAGLDLSPQRVDNMQMGYVFEELIRIGAEQSNEEAGEHFTPREVIRLMVSLLLSPEADLGKPHVVKTIYDPACGTGGMLTVAEKFLLDHNADARPHLFGQDINDESWTVCRSDMLIKGDDADRIVLGDSFTADGYQRRADDTRWTFDYMLANPPFGVEWKQQKQAIEKERDTESVPLGEGIDAYMEREVLPHVPDARVDHDKTKIGYEIPLNRHFYVYEPLRPLEAIEADLRTLETEIAQLLADVTA